MELSTKELNQAKGKIVSDIKTVITDGEDLLKAAANLSSASLSTARDTLDEKFNSVKTRVMNASRPAMTRARQSASAADDYVHGNPWTMIAAAAVAAVVVGMLVARR